MKATSNSLSSENQRLINEKKTADHELALANNAIKELSQALRRAQDNLDKSESKLREMNDYSTLERSVRDKDMSFQRMEQQIREEVNRRESIEAEFRNYKNSMQRTEEAVKSMTEDVRKVSAYFALRFDLTICMKGNDIIQKLQTEIRSLKSKLKLKNMVSLQQEKLLEERSSSVEQLNSEIQQMKEEAKHKLEEMELSRETVQTLKKKLEESKVIIEENANGESLLKCDDLPRANRLKFSDRMAS